MKGITFSTIAFVLIALVAVIILLSIFRSLIPGFVGRALCRVYQAILVLPLPSQLKPTIPGCLLIPGTTRIDLSGKTDIRQDLVDYIKKCWEQSERGRGGITFICYEIYDKSVTVLINEKDIADMLKQQNYCNILANNLLDVENQNYDCGDKNLIYWRIGEIKGSDVTVIIKYNAFIHRLEVI